MRNLQSRLKTLRNLNVFITENPKICDEDVVKIAKFTYSIKDIFSTKNIKTTAASNALKNYQPNFDSTVVEILNKNGGLLIGKTNSDEFSMGTSSTRSPFGAVKSPYSMKDNLDLRLDDDWLIPGGSSGGSAVAVAMEVCDVAFGSDTGGSTRNPAAHCGIIGVKPSYGRISRHGMIPLVNSMDCVGVFTNTVQKAMHFTEMLSGHDIRDGTSIAQLSVLPSSSNNDDISQLRIGIPNEYRTHDLQSCILDTWRSTVDLLADDGYCKMSNVEMPHTTHSIIVYHILGECDVASNMARYDGVEYGMRSTAQHAGVNELYAASRLLSFGDLVRKRILVGNYFLLKEHYDKYFTRAMRLRRLISLDFENVFKKVDILITPVTQTTASLNSEFHSGRNDDYFTQPVNMAGVCAMSIPVANDKNGLPIGLQIIANHGEESKMFQVAEWLEKRVKFEKLNVSKVFERLEQ